MQSKNRSIFEKIIDGELPCDKVFENEKVLAFRDIHPRAPVHILIVPKKAISSIQTMSLADYPYLVAIIEAAQEIARRLKLDQSGYRLLVNHGDHAGQTIHHLHFHLLGGEPLGPMN